MQEKPASPGSDRLFAALVSLGYLLAGLAWIGLSDRAGGLLFSSSEALTRFQSYKGAGFVVASTVLVFLLAARGSQRLPVGPGGRSRVGLSTLLAVLVLVTAVPLAATLGFNVLRQSRASAQEAQVLVQGFAHATSARLLAYLEDRHRLSRRLAQRPAPTAGGATDCDPLWSQAVALLDDIQDALLLDADGNVVCAARAGAGVRVTASQLGARLLVSVPPGLGRPDRFALTHRVEAAGTAGSVQLLLEASRLQRVASGSATGGVAIALLTTDGRLLAGAPEQGGLPTDAEAALLARDARAGRATRLARGADGRERLHALRPVAGTNLLVAAAVDTEDTIAPARRQALRSLAAAAAVVLLAGLLLASIVRRITGPMKALAQSAEAVAGGDFERRAPEAGPPEVASVAVQFNRMLDRLPALERELRESEERHRTLLQNLSRNLPAMIFQLRMEPDGRTSLPFASDASLRLLELAPEALAQDFSAALERVHPDDVAGAIDKLQRSRERQEGLYARYRVVLPRGGLRYYLTSAQPELLADGACVWHGCTLDVTVLEEARMALREANATLEARVAERTRALAAANESLESFSYSVAHDLRAPLAAIEGFTGALPAVLERGDAARLARLADRVAANTRQMGAMIDGLLQVARAGKGELQDVPVTMATMVERVVAELSLPPSVQVEIGALPVVRGDPATLRQVWWNLLANAAKFSAQRARPRIVVACEERDGELVFSVCDNGAGFDPHYAGRLFTAFQRLHDVREFEGTGIGLALVRCVVERHGGRAWAEGRPDQGACFYFSLPADRRQAGAVRTPPAPTP